MTIASVSNKIVYVGDETTSVYPYTFKIFAETDLTVSRVNQSSSAVQVLTLNTDYTVTDVGVDAGGNVVLSAGYCYSHSGSNLVIQRIVPFTQLVDYVANDPFPAETLEEALDKNIMVCQQLQEQVDRCIKAPIDQVTSGTTYIEVIAGAIAASASSAVVCLTAAAEAVTYSDSAGASAILAAAAAATASWSVIRVSFGDASLSAGSLDINHNLALPEPCSLQINVFDSNGYMLWPDNVGISANDLHIILTTANFTVTGTWSAIYVG